MKTVFAITMFAILLATSPSARADDVDCSGSIGAVTVDGNVLVAATCSLDGTTVKGNVELFAGGSLTAQNVDIIGNIQGVDAFEVSVSDSDIGGSVQLEKLVGDATIRNNAIIGSIQLKENRFQLVADGNTVGADIQAFENFGGVDITSNTVDGNLQCKDNAPEPTGGNNVVSGNKEDQCANLQLASSGPALSTAGTSASSSSGGGTAGPLFVLGLLVSVMLLRRNRGH